MMIQQKDEFFIGDSEESDSRRVDNEGVKEPTSTAEQEEDKEEGVVISKKRKRKCNQDLMISPEEDRRMLQFVI